ncbi:MAG: sodium:solute symporter family protein [Candidatus Sumerlaeia bacterium]|nr:sodium:solute symporter family protein [Candidatus Sumerlaeia bacterium]
MIGLFPLVYFALVLGLGLAFRRGVASEEGFFLARRSGSTLLLTGSLLATMFGSFGVLGVSGLASRMGLVAGWYHWVGTIGLIVLGVWALGRLKMEGAYTLPEVMGRVYGRPVRQLAALLIVFGWVSIVAAQLIAAGKVLDFMGVQSGWWQAARWQGVAIAIVGAVFVAYTCLGGQHAILRTDLLQAAMIVLALGALVLGALATYPDALREADPALLAFPFSSAMGPWQWVILLLTFGVPFLVGPDFYSRILSGRTVEAGRRAVLLAAVAMIPVVMLVVLGGVLGRVVVGEGLRDGELVLLELGVATAAPLWCGLLIAALLAAVMSSADTCLLTISTLVSRDLLDPLGLRPRDEAAVVRRGRWIVLIAGCVALAVALWQREIVRALWNCYKLYSPSVLVPFVAMLVLPGRRFRPVAGVAAVVLGGGTAALAMVLKIEWLGHAAFVLPAVPLAMDLLLGNPRPRD